MKKPAIINNIIFLTMNNAIKILISLYLIVFAPSLLLAQQKDCAVNLREAQNQFEMGQVQLVPGLILDCLKSGFTPEEKIQAYKVLINAYIFDDNMAQAEIYTLEFMRKYPEYEVVATDPSEFTNLLDEFNNDPRSSIGLGGGLNFSQVRVIRDFGVNSFFVETAEVGAKNEGNYNSSGSGFQAGLIYNINLGPNLEISLEPMIIKNTFEFEHRPFDFAFVEYSEDQLRIDFPISLIWVFKSHGKLDPYVRLGGKTSNLISAKSDSKRSYDNTGFVAFEDVTGAGLEINDNRRINNYWAVFGGGFRYKIPRAYFFVDIRYNLGLVNQVNMSSRNDGMNENIWLYYYMEDDFLLDDISISFGVSKTLYKPKRK